MKLLVTGGAGFIGSNLVDRLVAGGHQVTVLDNLSTGNRAHLNGAATFVRGDVQHIQKLLDKQKFDAVYHLAALARISRSFDSPIPTFEANVNGTLAVLEYCRSAGAKLIFSSSSSIFSGEELPTHEASPQLARNPYSQQKMIDEQLINFYRRIYGMPAVILRYFNVYGARMPEEGPYALCLGIFLDRCARNLPLQITGDGSQRRAFTHIDDVTDANVLALDWDGDYNIGREVNQSINEIARAISSNIEYIPARAGEVRDTLADNTKARQCGWRPSRDVFRWIEQQLAILRLPSSPHPPS